MRRTWIAVGVMLLVGLASAPASAGEHHIDVQDEVFQGRKLRIKVQDCVSGEGWTAYISIVIKKPDGSRDSNTKVANDTGLDIIKWHIPRRDPRGLYRAKVDCDHRFGKDDVREFFSEKETFRVLEPD